MRILFYVQRIDDAHLAQGLAHKLKSELDVESFSAVSFREAPEGDYLKNKTDGLFLRVLSETQMHRAADEVKSFINQDTLNRIESYGLPFWHYVSNNRFLIMKRANYTFAYDAPYKREDMLRHVQVRFEMTERFLDEVKPDLIIYTGVDVGPSSALILEQVAKARNIPLVVPISSKIGNYHTLTDTIFSRTPHVEARYNALEKGVKSEQLESAAALIAAFREGNVTLPYLAGVKVGSFERKLEPGKAANKLTTITRRRITRGPWHKKHRDVFNLSQAEYDQFRLAIEYRNFRMKMEGFFKPPLKNEKFVFFPLHVEPELALLLYAPYHLNQNTVIRNVAQSLPWDTCLYAKEHPQGIGKKPLAFYRELKGIANVRFVPPALNSRSLIADSQGVVTITGTAGLEAMLMGKPAVTLGEVFYNFMPLVKRAEKAEDLPHLTREFASFKPDEAKLTRFVAALLDTSINVDPEGLARDLMTQTLEEKLADTTLTNYAQFVAKHIKAQRVQEVAA